METLIRIGLSNAAVVVALAAAVAVAGLFLRRPALVHALWVVVLLKLVTPPLFRIPVDLPGITALAPPAIEAPRPSPVPAAPHELPLPELPDPHREGGSERPLAGSVPVPIDEARPEIAIAPQPPKIIEESPEGPIGSREAETPEASAPVAAAGKPLPDLEPPAPVDGDPTPGARRAWALAAILWLAGMVLYLALAAVRTFRFLKFLGRALPAPPETVRQVEEISARMGLRRPPRPVVLDGLFSPMLWGFPAPCRIILPAALWEGLDGDRRATLLAHELAHLRRGDQWVRLLEVAVTGLYWWHPVVWWAKREIEAAEEECCDAWVTWAMPGSGGTYGQALLETLDFLSTGRGPAPALGSRMGFVRGLRRRMEKIVSGAVPRRLGIAGIIAVAAACALALPFLPGATSPEDAKMAKTPEAAGPPPAGPDGEGGGALGSSGEIDGDARIFGRVVRGGQAVAGVTVRLKAHRILGPENAFPARTAVTGADGRFTFDRAPSPRRVCLEIDEPSSALRLIRGSGEESDLFDLGDIPLEPSGTLEMRVEGPEGNGVEGATVLVRCEAGSSRGSFYESHRLASEIGDGGYRLARCRPCSGTIDIWARNCRPAVKQYEVPSRDPIVIRMEPGLNFSGTVRDPDGRPIAGAKIRSPREVLFPRPDLETDSSGRFVIDSLGPGSFSYEIRTPGFITLRLSGNPEGSEAPAISLGRESVLQGIVVDGETGKPVAGARIEGSRERSGGNGQDEILSDGAGRFEMRGLSPGRIRLKVSRKGYARGEEKWIDLPENGTIEAGSLRLSRGIEIRGTVVAAATGEPVPSASYVLSEADSEERYRPTLNSSSIPQADRAGAFVEYVAASGNFSIEAWADGYGIRKISRIEVPPEGLRDLKIELPKGASISGRVLLASGQPLAGAEVRPALDPERVNDRAISRYLQGRSPITLLPRGAFAWPSARTDPAGSFRLSGLPPGEDFYVTAIEDAGGYGVVGGIVVRDGGATEGIEIRLTRWGSIRGRVVDGTGKGVEGVFVQRIGAAGQQESPEFRPFPGGSQATTGSDGRYILDRLVSGSYRVQALQSKAVVMTGNLELPPGVSIEAPDLVLGMGETLAGRVIDDGGNPVSGAEIRVTALVYTEGRNGSRSGSGWDAGQATSGEGGRFEIRGIPSGEVRIDVRKKGFDSSSIELSLPGDPPEIALVRLGRISGRIRSPGRETFPPFGISAKRSSGQEEPSRVGRGPRMNREMSTDATGRFSVEVPAGEWILTAHVPGYLETQSSPIEIEGGASREDIAIDLTKGASIRGKVLLEGVETPIEGAEVECSGTRERNFPIPLQVRQRSGTDGLFQFDGLPENVYALRVTHSLYPGESLEGIAVESGKIRDVSIKLKPAGIIRGTVVDAASGNPLEGIAVRAYGRSSSTDEEGRFTLSGLKPGRVTVAVEKGAYRRAEARVTVPSEDAVILRLERRATIAGTVRGGHGDLRASGEIQAFPADRPNSSPDQARIDVAGRFEVFVDPGTYILRARISGFPASESAPVEVRRGERKENVSIDIVEGGTIRGKVIARGSGRPIQEARIEAFPSKSVGSRRSARDERLITLSGRLRSPEGSFLLEGVPEGEIEIRVRHPDYPEARIPGVISKAGKTTEIVVEMEEGLALQGRAMDGSDGKGLTGVSIYVQPAEKTEDVHRARSDGEGRFEIRGVLPGKVRVSASHEDYCPLEMEASVPAAEDLVLRFDRLSSIAGTVRAPGGIPEGRASVSVRSTEKAWRDLRGGRIDRDGRFEVRVPPGTYIITARIPGYPPVESSPVTMGRGEEKRGVDFQLSMGGTIHGTAILRLNGKPLPDVQISIDPSRSLDHPGSSAGSATSDERGDFFVTGVPEGEFLLTASAPGHPDATVDGIRSIPGERAEVQVLIDEGASIRGVVTGDGRPAAGATLWIYSIPPNQRRGGDARTDPDGRFEKSGLAPGRYGINVNFKIGGRDYRSHAEVDVVEGGVAEIKVEARRGILLRGTIRSGGIPLTAGKIEVRRVLGEGERDSRSIGPAGAYSVDVPRPGRYVFSVSPEREKDLGTSWTYSVVEIPEGAEEVQKELDLPAGGGIFGVIVDAVAGTPIAKATVQVLPSGTSFRRFMDGTVLSGNVRGTATSGKDGRFEISGFSPGRYRIRAWAEGYAPAVLDGIEAGSARPGEPLRIALGKGYRVTASVADPEGSPPKMVVGMMRDREGEIVPGIQGFSGPESPGTLTFETVPEGEYEILAQSLDTAISRAKVRVGSEVSTVSITLRPGGILRANVKDRSGAPVIDAIIEIVDADGKDAWEDQIPGLSRFLQETDEEGRCEIGPLAPGDYRLRAGKGGRRSDEIRATVVPGKTIEAVIEWKN
jgi:beta-lactamase regulating signal transducer with metallopeptidase domain/protocatechuate 3,4-dioxygenase beta subunit